MPLVEIRSSVASADYAYQEGETVEVSGERATELVQRGYGVLVRAEPVETPEPRAARPETPEDVTTRTRTRRRGGQVG